MFCINEILFPNLFSQLTVVTLQSACPAYFLLLRSIDLPTPCTLSRSMHSAECASKKGCISHEGHIIKHVILKKN